MRAFTLPGWKPISTSGPQILPAASGGVSAFKFRDPEGHPLELIGFAAGAVPPPWQATSRDGCLGIDHSAVSVTDTSNSVAFYQSLGLHRSGGSLNVGTEQGRLDDIRNAVVEVTALSPAQPTPHVELLCYRGDFNRRVRAQAPNDATATRLVFSVDDRATLDRLCARHADALLSGPAAHDGDARRAMLRDPDGHLICLRLRLEERRRTPPARTPPRILRSAPRPRSSARIPPNRGRLAECCAKPIQPKWSSRTEKMSCPATTRPINSPAPRRGARRMFPVR